MCKSSPSRPSRHELLNGADGGEEAVILADHQGQAKALRQVDGFSGLGYRRRKGLLHQDMLSGVQTGLDHRDV